jgi:hypothetical protein
MEAALRDGDQYLVSAITAWKGNPSKRSNMKFWVQYSDGDEMWVSYSTDLVDNAKYKELIDRDPRLFQLRFNALDAPRMIAAMRREPITTLAPGDRLYVDLRCIKGHEARCPFYDACV